MPSQVTNAHTNIHACPNYRGTPIDAGFVPVDAVSLGVAIVTARLALLIIAVSALALIVRIGTWLWSILSASFSSMPVGEHVNT